MSSQSKKRTMGDGKDKVKELSQSKKRSNVIKDDDHAPTKKRKRDAELNSTSVSEPSDVPSARKNIKGSRKRANGDEGQEATTVKRSRLDAPATDRIPKSKKNTVDKDARSSNDERDQKQLLRWLADDIDLPDDRHRHVSVVLRFLADDGMTVPFIARYRKEATGGMTDEEIRKVAEKAEYYKELLTRRRKILTALSDAGKLTKALDDALKGVRNKAHLEELYAPFKPAGKGTKLARARAAGLAPLAEHFWKSRPGSNASIAKDIAAYRTAAQENKWLYEKPEEEVDTSSPYLASDSKVEEALILLLSDTIAADSGSQETCRQRLERSAILCVNAMKKKNDSGKDGKEADTKSQARAKSNTNNDKDRSQKAETYATYAAFSCPVSRLESYQLLAINRGIEAGFLKSYLTVDRSPTKTLLTADSTFVDDLRRLHRMPNTETNLFKLAFQHAWKERLAPRLRQLLLNSAKEWAEEEAIKVFAKNLRDLLLAAPAGHQVVLGLDPGYAHGVKVAVIDGTGKVLAHKTVYPHAPRNQREEAERMLRDLCVNYAVQLMAIGNGTASRETMSLAREVAKRAGRRMGSAPTVLLVSEAGASVYSASSLAVKELPDMDVSHRGAVSIARRLQDPLAELIKIDPKSIGVGQYQHDFNQKKLAASLDGVVEDCVNAVGVQLNTASEALLTHVAGLTAGVAKKIIAYRDEHGAFANRQDLRKVDSIGPRRFEQAAGFLRLALSPTIEEPLDATGIHPEAYELTYRMLASVGIKGKKNLRTLLMSDEGVAKVASKINIDAFVDEKFGLPTIQDIIKELQRAGSDSIRGMFQPPPSFDPSIQSINDIKPNQKLPGVVTNITQFGVFVDVGVHHDGLIHRSKLRGFDAKVGENVMVVVLDVDVKRGRIGLRVE